MGDMSTMKKKNRWYLVYDEPIYFGGFRKDAEIGGDDDLQGLLNDMSISVGTLLQKGGKLYIVQEADRGYSANVLDRAIIKVGVDNSIDIHCKNVSLKLNVRSYTWSDNSVG